MANWYVSPTGNDTTGNGSQANPWRTGTGAVAKSGVVAGDTLYFMGQTVSGWSNPLGIYREQFNINKSGNSSNPITFKAFAGHTIIFSALNLLTGWTLHSGNIWKATFTGTLNTGTFPHGNNQLFVTASGQLPVQLPEARWPKVPSNKKLANLKRTDWAYVDSATGSSATAGTTTTSTITDADLTQFAAGSLVGAKASWLPGAMWGTTSGVITAQNNSTGTITIQHYQKSPSTTYQLKAGNYYFLFGSLNLLGQGEWYLDDTTSTMYLWMPDNSNPNNATIEIKARAKVLEPFAQQYLKFEDLTFIGGRVNTGSSSGNLTFKNCTFRNGTHATYITEIYTSFIGANVILAGQNNLIDSCVIYENAAGAIDIAGNTTVVNTSIYDTCYVAYTSGCRGEFLVSGSNNLISNCILTGRGSSRAIEIKCNNSIIEYCYTSEGGRLTLDEGDIFCWRGTNGGTNSNIIRYNTIDSEYNLYNGAQEWFGYASFYVEDVTNFIFYRNVVRNTARIALKGASGSTTTVKFYNNTAPYSQLFIEGTATYYFTGTEFKNNIFASFQFGNSYRNDITWQGNASVNASYSGILYANNPGFGSNFTLVSTSPLRNAGVVISGWTDGYLETFPDIGANEFVPTVTSYNFKKTLILGNRNSNLLIL